MGRAGFQHRWDDSSDRDGFQPGDSGEAETHDTAYRHTDSRFNTATKTHRYAQTVGQAHTYAYPRS